MPDDRAGRSAAAVLFPGFGRMGRAAILAVALLLLALPMARPASAGEVSVAVAANFTEVAQELARDFEARTGNEVKLSFASTGQLYAQIANGAPFDIFLAADTKRPIAVEESGWAVGESRFTYAIGRLVLWSAEPGLVDEKGLVLRDGGFTHIALANPKTAPYGQAAVETLEALGLYDAVKDRIVMGESVSQTYQFVASGNAELGFMALSQVISDKAGSHWVVPETLYAPILQDAVLLETGAENEVATAFYAFLKSDTAAETIQRYGYGTISAMN